jgi:hypothetical protein
VPVDGGEDSHRGYRKSAETGTDLLQQCLHEIAPDGVSRSIRLSDAAASLLRPASTSRVSGRDMPGPGMNMR